MKKIIYALIISIVLIPNSLFAQTTYYSNNSTTNFNSLSGWGINADGSGASPSVFDNTIILIMNHNKTTSSTVTVRGITIHSGVVLQADHAITISSGTFAINDGGTYIHNNTTGSGGTIFNGSESFSSASNIEIKAWQSTGSLQQGISFGNLTWNISSGTGNPNLGGGLTNIQGNFSINSTGTSGSLVLSGTSDYTLNIGGNLSISGGTLNTSNGSSGTFAINLAGNFSQSGGTFTHGNNNSPLTFNFGGTSKSFTQSAGTFTTSNINFSNTPGSTITLNSDLSIAAVRTFSIGGILICGSSKISGAGSFSLASGATLKTAHASGVNGSITTSGTNSFDPAANYEFNGSSAQVTGSLLTSANNLIINNPAGVSLSTSVLVNGTLTLSSGILNLNANSMSLGSSASITGSPSASNMIVATGTGFLAKSFSGTGSFTFPIGDNSGTNEYSPASINFTSGTFSEALVSVIVTNSKHSANASSTNYLNRYWTVNSTGVSAFSCDVSFNYVDADINGTESSIFLGKYASGSWTLLDAASTSSNQFTGTVTSFSDFTGGESGALPVELTSFTSFVINKTVSLNWETATEINNYGFEVLRSSQIDKWEKVGFVNGNGNSNSPKYYSFEDKPTGGKEFQYKLKQIDFDGRFEYSDVISITLSEINQYKLVQNFPNPFNPATIITYQLPIDGFVKLKVYDAIGREVADLVNENKKAGYYEIKFDGSRLNSGIYFYRIEAGNFSDSKKLILIK